MYDHEKWMLLALEEARKALAKAEVPVGAVVVCEDQVVGRGHNMIETLQDATAHAEMLAITAAASKLASWRLESCALYVTLEPCPMCAGAALFSRLSQIIYGTEDARYGACGSAIQVVGHQNLDLKTTVLRGVLKDDCSRLLTTFFQGLRSRERKSVVIE